MTLVASTNAAIEKFAAKAESASREVKPRADLQFWVGEWLLPHSHAAINRLWFLSENSGGRESAASRRTEHTGSPFPLMLQGKSSCDVPASVIGRLKVTGPERVQRRHSLMTCVSTAPVDEPAAMSSAIPFDRKHYRCHYSCCDHVLCVSRLH